MNAEPASATRPKASRNEIRAGGSADSAVATNVMLSRMSGEKQFGQFAAQDEDDQQEAAHDGHAQQHLERGFRHELDDGHLPVRRGHERPALEHRPDVDSGQHPGFDL